jgi:asparagine synthase (glutamine-hydrolysing)
MCGIAGIIDQKAENKEQIIDQMVKRILHRGPDEDGFFCDDFVGLGMRRLSIIDLSTGQQPIFSDDKKWLIFFNGEIYNYQELREELVKLGVKMNTESDTEVILQMFITYGEAMLPRLRGMFAFCIYNTETKNIFLARDFFGIKPLYYLKIGQKITAFGSEIKSFLDIPIFKAEVNDEAVYNYLSFQYNPLDQTFFKNVWKLPPAHWLKIDAKTGEFEIKKYWSFEFAEMSKRHFDTKDEMARMPVATLDEKKIAQKIKETMRDSVAHHMIADVPVGSFLSGGVDSSIIATLMQEIRGDKKIKTFTVGFDTLTEGREASQTSDFLGTDHHEIKIGPDEYFAILPKAVWHFDEPVADPSAIGLYFVAREARKHVTVVLSGEGADEFFGGYNIYLAPYAYRKISWLPKSLLGIALKIPFGFWGKNYIRRVHDKIENWYIGNASIFKSNDIKKLWKVAPGKKFSLDSLYKNVAGQSDSVKMQYIDINTWLVGDILAKADKMTMANSLELRVPFLDTSVAYLAKTLPDNFKWRGGVTKYLLREAFKDVIPEETRNRKKLGFPTPVRDWFTAGRQNIYDTILKNPYIKEKMDTAYIQKLINDHIAKRADNSRKIYALLMLALWHNVFIQKNDNH